MNCAYLLLGGNESETFRVFGQVVTELEQEEIRLIRRSHIYQSPSWGFESLPFLNQALEVETAFSAPQLLGKLLKLEELHGRKRNGSGYTDRVIDIDILFFNREIIALQELSVPHPRLHLRNFALVPLNEIAPDYVHPSMKKSIAELLLASPDHSQVEPVIYQSK